jgi:hypothetical protein
MRSIRNLSIAAPLIAVTLAVVPNAAAQCSGFRPLLTHPTSWQPTLGHGHLQRAAFAGALGQDDPALDDVSIVGFWHVKFVSDGISTGIPGGIPKGAEVDAGYSQWHSDGTEIMNSGGRAPNTGDYCLGVWAKVGVRRYKLNHFGAAWDPTKGAVGPAGPAGELIGPGHIQEEVTLHPGGDSFTGSFSTDQYDESGNLLVHLEGKITGTRINVNTPESSVF